METKIHYFDSPGKQNTEKVVDLAVKRAKDRKIESIVVASSTGRTGVIVAEKARKKGIQTIVVTYAYGFSKKSEWEMKKSNVEKLGRLGVPIISATHALSGVERSITKKLGGASRVEAVAEALRSLFGQGMKVCVEISLMAADAGKIPCDDDAEIIAIAGAGEGADTAVIIRPSNANAFFDLQIREVIAMPRTR
ncbi:MAG TPA: pyruvate kinase alpha/beta domain-containing protein [Thermoplasmata archaeon]|nr:pyruvate kinase alpha/beta domain-containing protein [Thermoplasmata archaeon]